MGVRSATWLVALPLLAAGWLTAHALAYELVAPDAHHRARLLAETGHGYLSASPTLIAVALALIVCGFGLAVVGGLLGTAGRPVPLWPLALVAPVGFAMQEHLERLFELNAFPAGAALEPSFLVGMALQLPFALAALLIARAVLLLAEALGGARAAPLPLRPVAVAVAAARVCPRAPVPAPLPVLATGHAERAPPPLGS